MTDRGRVSRAARLGLRPGGRLHLLALDHGLSLGWEDNQESPATIAKRSVELGVNGVICHYGLLERLKSLSSVPVFMQLHGSTSSDSGKVPIASALLAATADCVGVAVEFQSQGTPDALARTTRLIQNAQEVGLLVLVMANFRDETYHALSRAIVGATQLGADLIKIRVPTGSPATAEITRIRSIVEDAPPVLVAGGDSSISLKQTLEVASRLGFRGTCIGRHYFTEKGRDAAWALVSHYEVE